ncbi:MAG: response regulator [Bryobacteraceae bacterium]
MAGRTAAGAAVAPEATPLNDYDQLKGEFLASLNHELRTPLTGVIGMSDLLAETPLSDEQAEYLGDLRECARQLLESLNSVLDYSAWTAGRFRLEASEFELRPVLDALVEETREAVKGKNLHVHAEWDPEIPETVVADEVHLRQLLAHLLRNAAKFTAEGEIRVTARVETEVVGWNGPLPSPAERRWVRFAVADTGIGIPSEKLDVIFDSFRQLDGGLARRYRGLGLGLTLARTIAVGMGGFLSVQSQTGDGESASGTIFEALVPLQIAAPIEHAEPAAEDRQRRILIVDDNRIAQAVVSHALRKGDYLVESAANGQRAIMLAAAEKFDLVLMDLQMPVMDGFTTCREIRRLPGYEETPIVALTANFSDEQRKACAQAGMQGYLAKPVQRAELLVAVARHLGLAVPAEEEPIEAAAAQSGA